jgi:hypothetical protein
VGIEVTKSKKHRKKMFDRTYTSSSCRSSWRLFFDCSNSNCRSMSTILFCNGDNSGTKVGTRSTHTALKKDLIIH